MAKDKMSLLKIEPQVITINDFLDPSHITGYVLDIGAGGEGVIGLVRNKCRFYKAYFKLLSKIILKFHDDGLLLLCCHGFIFCLSDVRAGALFFGAKL